MSMASPGPMDGGDPWRCSACGVAVARGNDGGWLHSVGSFGNAAQWVACRPEDLAAMARRRRRWWRIWHRG
jgi:hypothetical protein